MGRAWDGGSAEPVDGGNQGALRGRPGDLSCKFLGTAAAASASSRPFSGKAAGDICKTYYNACAAPFSGETFPITGAAASASSRPFSGKAAGDSCKTYYNACAAPSKTHRRTAGDICKTYLTQLARRSGEKPWGDAAGDNSKTTQRAWPPPPRQES